MARWRAHDRLRSDRAPRSARAPRWAEGCASAPTSRGRRLPRLGNHVVIHSGTTVVSGNDAVSTKRERSQRLPMKRPTRPRRRGPRNCRRSTTARVDRRTGVVLYRGAAIEAQGADARTSARFAENVTVGAAFDRRPRGGSHRRELCSVGLLQDGEKSYLSPLSRLEDRVVLAPACHGRTTISSAAPRSVSSIFKGTSLFHCFYPLVLP